MDVIKKPIPSQRKATAKAGAFRVKRSDTSVRDLVKATFVIEYKPAQGIEGFARELRIADVIKVVETERHGVSGRILKDLAIKLALPSGRLFEVLGVPKATAEKKIARNELLKGAGGSAVLGMMKLLNIAQRIVDKSTAEGAPGFNTAKWLGEWIEQPQPALGGRKPSEFLDTTTGVEAVSKVLNAVESGAYL